MTEAKLAAKLEKVTERLSAGAGNMEQPGAVLIAYYLDPGRLPVQDRWSRKHAHTQRRLCERFAAPVIGAVTCQDITTFHTQQIVSAAPTAGEGNRVHRRNRGACPASKGARLLARKGDLRILAGGKQEIGEERDTVVPRVKPRDLFAFRLEEHVTGLQNRGWLALGLVDHRALKDAPDYRTVVHVKAACVAGQDSDLADLDPVGALHLPQSCIK